MHNIIFGEEKKRDQAICIYGIKMKKKTLGGNHSHVTKMSSLVYVVYMLMHKSHTAVRVTHFKHVSQYHAYCIRRMYI